MLKQQFASCFCPLTPASYSLCHALVTLGTSEGSPASLCLILTLCKAWKDVLPSTTQFLLPPIPKVKLVPFRPNRSFSSSSGGFLFIPSTRLVAKGNPAFSVRDPWLWNSLLVHPTQAKSVSSFNSLLDTHFYRKAFQSFYWILFISPPLPDFFSNLNFT